MSRSWMLSFNSLTLTRKLVLANGYAGSGGPNVPDIIRKLPANMWTHTASPIQFDAFARKVVGVLGAGASAFDAAAAALEHGAAEVHLYSRRAFVDYQGGPPPASPTPPLDRGYGSSNELLYELPDEVRWRAHLQRRRRVASVPLDSLERAVSFKSARFTPSLDVFNVANSNTIQAIRSRQNASNANQIQAIVAPRVIRFGVRVSW